MCVHWQCVTKNNTVVLYRSRSLSRPFESTFWTCHSGKPRTLSIVVPEI